MAEAVLSTIMFGQRGWFIDGKVGDYSLYVANGHTGTSCTAAAIAIIHPTIDTINPKITPHHTRPSTALPTPVNPSRRRCTSNFQACNRCGCECYCEGEEGEDKAKHDVIGFQEV